MDQNLPWHTSDLPIPTKKRRKKVSKAALARKRQKAKGDPPQFRNERPCVISLSQRHLINGIAYGPGAGLTVPFGIAQELLNREAQWNRVEHEFWTPKGVIIGPASFNGSYSTRQVPYETFDIGQAPEIDHISGKGMTDQGQGRQVSF